MRSVYHLFLACTVVMCAILTFFSLPCNAQMMLKQKYDTPFSTKTSYLEFSLSELFDKSDRNAIPGNQRSYEISLSSSIRPIHANGTFNVAMMENIDKSRSNPNDYVYLDHFHKNITWENNTLVTDTITFPDWDFPTEQSVISNNARLLTFGVLVDNLEANELYEVTAKVTFIYMDEPATITLTTLRFYVYEQVATDLLIDDTTTALNSSVNHLVFTLPNAQRQVTANYIKLTVLGSQGGQFVNLAAPGQLQGASCVVNGVTSSVEVNTDIISIAWNNATVMNTDIVVNCTDQVGVAGIQKSNAFFNAVIVDTDALIPYPGASTFKPFGFPSPTPDPNPDKKPLNRQYIYAGVAIGVIIIIAVVIVVYLMKKRSAASTENAEYENLYTALNDSERIV